MKIEFLTLKIEGFCSIPKLELNLNRDYITIIRGSNGNGKSSILSALVWCIYGKNIKGISDVNTWSKYQPSDYQGTKVEITYNISGVFHKIIRCQNYKGKIHNVKGGNGIYYYIGGKMIEDKYKTGIQSQIEDNIGMSYNLFLNSVMFGQGLKRILQSSSSDQKKIFEELFSLQYISKAYDIAKDKLDDYKSNHNSLESQLKNLESNREYIEESISDFNHQKESQEFEVYKSIHKIRESISELESTYRVPREYTGKMDYDSILYVLERDYKRFKKEADNTSAYLVNAKNRLRSLNNSVEISPEKLIDNILKLLEDHKIDYARRKLRKLKSMMEESTALSLELEAKEQYLEGIKDSLRNIDIMLRENNHIKSRIESLEKQIESMQNFKPLDIRILEKNKTKLEKLNRDIEELESQLEPLDKNLELYEWLCSKPLSNNGLKTYIFSNSLISLNKVLQTYSEVLGFRIILGMDLKSARKDLTVDIYLDDINVFYEELSGGQKQLVNLAIAFAMNSLISISKGLNIVFLDEIFESLSSDNIEIVINLINHIYQGRSLFLITHQESLPLDNCQILYVENIRGLSHFKV